MNSQSRRRRAVVIGAGPAGLMAAEVLAAGGIDVTVFDRMPSPGRKFLLAGRGGLNLTHSEPDATFLPRYGKATPSLAPSLAAFGPSALRAWCAELGIETFVGTSGRVFPQGLKASPLLRAWLRRLAAQNVTFKFRHRWCGWDEVGRPRFETAEGVSVEDADVQVLALGGASWPRLGSDGAWRDVLVTAGIDVAPLQPSNCGFAAEWSEIFRTKFEGQPLKNVVLAFGEARARGDLVVTRAGLEGGPLYALSAPLREAIQGGEAVTLRVDLKPDMDAEAVAARLTRIGTKESFSNRLRKSLALSPVAIGLIRECAAAIPRSASALDLARGVKSLPVRLTAPMPMERAISSAGGVSFGALGATLMIRPGVFAAGEMLDWEAPTGGYLLQACFATGRQAGQGALDWLAANSEVSRAS